MAVETEGQRILGVRKLVFIENVWFYVFISPWIIGFLIFTVGPMLMSIGFSFMRWEVLLPPEFVGMQNWTRMFQDPLFWQALKVTTVYTIFNVPITLIGAFLLATLMNSSVRGITVFRTVYYLPSLVSGVAVAMLWTWLLNPKFGLINWGLSLVGIEGPAWLPKYKRSGHAASSR